jgi:hypothetical protein
VLPLDALEAVWSAGLEREALPTIGKFVRDARHEHLARTRPHDELLAVVHADAQSTTQDDAAVVELA